MAVASFVVLFAIVITISLIKRGRSGKFKINENVDYDAVAYDIRESTDGDVNNEDESAFRCSVCDTILPCGSTACPNCGTAGVGKMSSKSAHSVERRKIEFTVTSENVVHEEKKSSKSESSSSETSGPVMIGSLKSTMGGSKLSSEDKK